MIEAIGNIENLIRDFFDLSRNLSISNTLKQIAEENVYEYKESNRAK